MCLVQDILDVSHSPHTTYVKTVVMYGSKPHTSMYMYEVHIVQWNVNYLSIHQLSYLAHMHKKGGRSQVYSFI